MDDQIIGAAVIVLALAVLALGVLAEADEQSAWDADVDDAVKLAMHPATREVPLYDAIAEQLSKDLDAELEQLLRDGA